MVWTSSSTLRTMRLMSPPMPPKSTRFSRERALQGHMPGFGLQVAWGRGIGYKQHLPFLPFDFPPLSSWQLSVFGLAFHIPVSRRVHVATRWILWGPTFYAALAKESALHRMIWFATRFTTSFASHASTRIGSALASFLHRLTGGAEGISIL